MAHRKRRHFVRELERELPGAEVVWDRKNDRWDTGRRSLLAHLDRGSDYALVVQDDAIVCRNLVAGAAKAAEAAGERPVALYVGALRPHQHTIKPAVLRARKTGQPWVETWGPYWGVAIILPTDQIRDVVAWGDAHDRIANYDRRIAAYYQYERDLKCWYTVPSLVDHRGVDENPSLVPGRTGNRRAHWFIGDGDPLAIDWTLEPIAVGDVIRLRNTLTGRELAVREGSLRHRRLVARGEWEMIA